MKDKKYTLKIEIHNEEKDKKIYFIIPLQIKQIEEGQKVIIGETTIKTPEPYVDNPCNFCAIFEMIPFYMKQYMQDKSMCNEEIKCFLDGDDLELITD